MLSRVLDKTVSIGLGKAYCSTNWEEILVIHGLGSCIGLALYDPATRASVLCHVVLPSTEEANPKEPARFANTAVPWALNQMLSLGARRPSIIAKIVGGASLFGASTSLLSIGDRNIKAVTDAIAHAGLKLVAKEVGGDKGRTMTLYVADGRIEIRSAMSPMVVL